MADESILAKYKRLLALARNSLEANQASLAAKDKQISQLTTLLEEERAAVSNNQNRKQRYREQDEPSSSASSLIPRNLLRRLDVYDLIWMLVEYDGAPDAWISFNTEDDLNDYIQRVPGAPLVKPHRCLSEEESAKVERDAKLKIDRIVEEFRRYKVKVEISKKQKDSDPKQQQLARNNSGPGNENSMISDTFNHIHNQTDGNNNNDRSILENDLKKWITAYEMIARENEQLRTQAGDSLLVKKWQERYEEVMKEKEDLVSKLKIFTRSTESNIVLNNKFGHPISTSCPSSSHSNLNGYSINNNDSVQSSTTNKKTLQQSYVELKDEHKEFRRRMESLEIQRKQEIADLKAALLDATGGLLHDVDLHHHHSHSHSQYNQNNNNSSSSLTQQSSSSGSTDNASLTFTDSKVNYIRGMLLQYLSCKDPIVKPHIEHALMAIFRYNDQERAIIEEGHKNESQDAISAMTKFLGTSIINNFS